MRNARLIVALAVVLLVGIAAGYLYRRWKHPTLEERAQDATEDLRRGMEKMLKR